MNDWTGETWEVTPIGTPTDFTHWIDGDRVPGSSYVPQVGDSPVVPAPETVPTARAIPAPVQHVRAPSDLEIFLLARIAEDERVAHSSIAADEPGEPWGFLHIPGNGPHIARWDPARVLAECEAKRRIVERDFDSSARILRCMAGPYAEHPDYRSEWAL